MQSRTKKYKTEYGTLIVSAGKCHKCKKVTECFCDLCQEYICEKHMKTIEHGSNECYCEECIKKVVK